MGYTSFLYRQFFVHPPPVPPSLALEEQVILITGSNSGIGLEAARHCVKLNAHNIILAVRNLDRGEAAKADILRTCPRSKTNIEIWHLDMESFSSVLSFGNKAQSLARLDVAILNAGVFKAEWDTTDDGYESSLQVNHLSTALLSLLLLPPLRQTSRTLQRPTRLTFSSSEVHMWTSFKQQSSPHILTTYNTESRFSTMTDHYFVSKLLNVFWIRELVTRLASMSENEGEVVINFFNPGGVKTGLHRDTKPMQIFDALTGRTAEEGGRLVIDAAFLKGRETHGCYLSEAKVVDVSPFVRSEKGKKIQKQLWNETKELLEKKIGTEAVEVAFAIAV